MYAKNVPPHPYPGCALFRSAAQYVFVAKSMLNKHKYVYIYIHIHIHRYKSTSPILVVGAPVQP